MTGLLVKDIRILMKRKTYFAALFVIFLMMGSMMETSFLMTYLPLLAVLFTISTINYDEFDNGMAFLMTLPVKRSQYALEKYLLGLIFGAAGFVISLVVAYASAFTVQGIPAVHVLSTAITTVVPIGSLLMAVLLPVELKFGAEKGRIAMFIIYGIVFAAYLLGGKILSTLGIDIMPLLIKIVRLPDAVVNTAILVISFAALAISCMISMKIMEKKEY